ncbi:MAG: S-layer homology domain-containing protein [Candidatus Melainabacteria bacterium]|nr:S-layer homology domain-containing protein [Candidatus Melainabacteria bacterium]
MRASKRVGALVTIISATCLLVSAPASYAQPNWTQVPNYIDVPGRMTTVEKSIFEALAAGRLTQPLAQRFTNDLKQIRDQDTAFRADGKLSMFERVRIVMDLDKLNQDIQNSLTDRKVALTDVNGREQDIDRAIQEALLSGRLTDLEALGFKRTLRDIEGKERNLRADGVLSSEDLFALSTDLDLLTSNIEHSLRTRVVADPGIETKKQQIKQKLDALISGGQINAGQAELIIADLNQISAKEATFKASNNMLDNDEKLALSLEFERVLNQIEKLQPSTNPFIVKGVNEQQLEISKAINDAKQAGKLSIQDAAELTQEYDRIQAVEAMFRADQRLSNSEVTTLSRDLDALNKRIIEVSGHVQLPSLQDRKLALKKKIVDAQAAGRIKPATLANDFLNELERLESKEQFYRGDGSLNDTETLVVTSDLDALSTKVESSIAALPNVGGQKNRIQKRLNDALASGRLDPLKADELRQDLQRIAFLNDTFRGGDGVLDDREVVALNKEYTNLAGKLDRSLPALPDIDALQTQLESEISNARSKAKPKDLATLQREFDRINSIEASFRDSDQALSEWETLALKRDLDRLAEDITRITSVDEGGVTTVVDLAGSAPDVKGHWAQDYIAVLQQRGTIGGFPDGTFKPDQGITRSQFAAIAVKALGLPAGGREVEFKDLPKTHWAYKAICSASDAGLVGGFPDGSFRPEDKLTRAQALVILAKALGTGSSDAGSLGKYRDGSGVAAWAAPSVAKAAAAGIIVNHPDPYEIRPSDLATRAEVAALTFQTMAKLGQKMPPIRIGLEASSNSGN